MGALFPIQRTYGSTLAVCSECGMEISQLDIGPDNNATLRPCGHIAFVLIIPNPKLSAA